MEKKRCTEWSTERKVEKREGTTWKIGRPETNTPNDSHWSNLVENTTRKKNIKTRIWLLLKRSRSKSSISCVLLMVLAACIICTEASYNHSFTILAEWLIKTDLEPESSRARNFHAKEFSHLIYLYMVELRWLRDCVSEFINSPNELCIAVYLNAVHTHTHTYAGVLAHKDDATFVQLSLLIPIAGCERFVVFCLFRWSVYLFLFPFPSNIAFDHHGFFSSSLSCYTYYLIQSTVYFDVILFCLFYVWAYWELNAV